MNRSCLIFTLAVVSAVPVFAQHKMMGFTDSSANTQAQWEKRFDALLSEKNLDTWMKFLTSRPHHVGSAQGKKNAEYIAALFRSWGYDTQIEEYDVLFPSPKTRLLQLNGSKPFVAKLEEPALPQDKTSGQKQEQLPSYNAYSADGDVTAPLVFVNRGVPSDYEELEKIGIDVKGKIVIAKYGGSWRGIKPKVAAEHGAVGCIIYSDPGDDGYAAGDVYPEGAYRPSFGVQRGSVLDMPVYPGDPLTPGVGAVKNAERLDKKDAPTLMKIPVLPISYDDALPLLKSLKGPVAPSSWRGGLPLTYHIGPGVATVRLKVECNWDLKTAYNVIARLKGSEHPDQWIVRGNHHDAWVNGAADPVSGIIAEMEEARAIGELVKSGYALKRTLVYCAWDAEEQGLLGSVEWAEHHAKELKEKAVLYLNSDGTYRGFLNAGGSHTLEPFMNEVAEEVNDPQTKVSVKQRMYAKRLSSSPANAVIRNAGDTNFKLEALGSGSDWSAFLQHLGIASLNLDYAGEGEGGEYHSIYDSYDHFTKFKDPGFHYGVALAKTAGRVMMRMANAEVLPFDFASLSGTLKEYTVEVKSLLDHMRVSTEAENKLIGDSLLYLASDPKEKRKIPAPKEFVPFLDFSKLENALASLEKNAAAFHKVYASSVELSPEKRDALNTILYLSERALTNERGLPGRKWYRHQIYAPGLYTGYGVKTMPGIRESIEQRRWKEAQENIALVAERIKEFDTLVMQAMDVVNGAK